MVDKKKAFTVSLISAIAIGGAVYFVPSMIKDVPVYMIAGVTTFLVGYFGMIWGN